MKKLYVFGNEYLDSDKAARDIAPLLQDRVQLVHCRSPEDLLDSTEHELWILDVVRGIDKPILITNPDQIRTKNMLSLHDFDLGFFLQLLKELGEEKTIRIIGIPPQHNHKRIAKEVRAWI